LLFLRRAIPVDIELRKRMSSPRGRLNGVVDTQVEVGKLSVVVCSMAVEESATAWGRSSSCPACRNPRLQPPPTLRVAKHRRLAVVLLESKARCVLGFVPGSVRSSVRLRRYSSCIDNIRLPLIVLARVALERHVKGAAKLWVDRHISLSLLAIPVQSMPRCSPPSFPRWVAAVTCASARTR